MYNGLTKLLKEAAGDDRVVITALTGAGDFYSSGNDLLNSLEAFSSADHAKTIKQSLNVIWYDT
jgi:enoyl-CoA hydratase/carnithine racemase